MTTIFFVHVPKTAGTSFRQAAIKEFGNRNVVQDYGGHSPNTSKWVQKYVYRNDDRWALYQRMRDKGSKLICGHMRAKKFIPGVGVKNTAIVLREPVQRVFSAYQHAVRHKGFSGTFKEFYTQPGTCNIQAKHIDEVPLSAFGALGLTELYSEFLAVFNRRYGVDLKELAENKGRKKLEQEHLISEEDRKEVLRLNHKDVELYQKAQSLFDDRLSMYGKGLKYAHASLVTAGPKKVSGWAWWEGENDDPVSVEVRVNGEVRATAIAQQFRATLSQYCPPRGGHVGFVARVAAKPGDLIDCVISETGQVFPSSPVVVKKNRCR